MAQQDKQTDVDEDGRIPVSGFLANSGPVLAECHARDVVLTRHRKPAAVLMSYKRYLALVSAAKPQDSPAGTPPAKKPKLKILRSGK